MMTLPQPGPPSLRKNHAAISNGENRVAEVAVLAADPVEVIAEVAIFGERLRVVGERAVLAAEREIETRRSGQRRQLDRGTS